VGWVGGWVAGCSRHFNTKAILRGYREHPQLRESWCSSHLGTSPWSRRLVLFFCGTMLMNSDEATLQHQVFQVSDGLSLCLSPNKHLRVKTCRTKIARTEPIVPRKVSCTGSENGLLVIGSLDEGPATPPPAILGRTQQEAVCHDLNQKLLPPYRCRHSLV